MRRIGLALIALGVLGTLTGAALFWTGWIGQQDAKVRWDSEESQNGAAAQYTLSRLSFPSQGRNYFVLEGATEQNLLLGPARVEGSVSPGRKGNCIIAGHRDTHFRVLKDVKNGDEITLENRGRMFHYRIVETKVVRSADNHFYRPTARPVLTLVTCYPFYYVGSAPKRFIVRAELVDSSTQGSS